MFVWQSVSGLIASATGAGDAFEFLWTLAHPLPGGLFAQLAVTVVWIGGGLVVN